MTPAEFKEIGIQLYGRKHWRREYSINLHLDPSTVWRISTRDEEISGIVEVAVRGLLAEYQYRRRRERYARAKHAHERKKNGLPPKDRPRKRIVVNCTKKDIENELPDTPHDSD